MEKMINAILLAILSVFFGLFFSWAVQIVYGISLFIFIYYIINKDVSRGGYLDISGIFDFLYWLIFIIIMIVASSIALKFNIPQIVWNLNFWI